MFTRKRKPKNQSNPRKSRKSLNNGVENPLHQNTTLEIEFLSDSIHSDIIDKTRTRAQFNCIHGCKNYAAKFFVKYLERIGQLPTLNKTTENSYIRKMTTLDFNLRSKITNRRLVLNIPPTTDKLNIAFYSDLTKPAFNSIVENRIVFAMLYREERSINPIHTFIISNGNIIYNSWSSDTRINSKNRLAFNEKYVKPDEGSYYRVNFNMAPIRHDVKGDLYDNFHELITNPSDMKQLTDIFGLDKDNAIGLGVKKIAQKNIHNQIIRTDISSLLELIQGSNLFFVYVE
jgi:hypothetical protein